MTIELKLLSEELLCSLREQGYAGFDPFDGLNSRLFNFFQLQRSSFLRLAWLQVHKRLPINLRPLALVARKRNPKGIALFILGLVNDFKRTKEPSLLDEIASLCDWLLTQKQDVNKWGGACWGYHFPWQAKAFYVPEGKPNVITTVYCSRALQEASKLALINSDKYRGFSLSSGEFIYKSLFSKDSQGLPYIAYIPDEKAFVHNASLWGAAWLLFSGKELKKKEWISAAMEVVDRSVSAQGDGGEWVYGSLPHHQFIDGFHTGYNLEAIKFVSKTLQTREYDACLDQGLRYYKENMIGPNGEPYYYNTKPYPYDVHSSSQIVLTLLRVGGTREDIALAAKVIDWTVQHMYLPKEKRFLYQINRLYKNKVNYVRWTQAWACLMLSEWNLYESKKHVK